MKHLIIGTAGHIDHGKTSLVKMLTGIDCDTHKEEKQRGITINLGFSYLNLPGGESAGIIDVPGHKDFINTMIGGACGIDLVLLIIAADSGIMPQTIEHMNIITALGIDKGIVALTKTDLVDEELLEIAESEITEFLSKTPLKNAPVIRVSSITGSGKQDLIDAISAIITNIKAREVGRLFRMYVDRIFTVKGFGSVVTGSVMGGSLSTGQEVWMIPGYNQKHRVRALERHGQTVEKVMAGDRAAINLIGLKPDEFDRGMVLCEKQVESTQMIDAWIQLFETDVKLPVWSNIIFITGTFVCQARIHLLNKDIVRGNEDAIVQIHLSKPAVLFSKDRFIIRNSSEDKTLGGGYIIEASPLHHRKRTDKLIAELIRLSHGILEENSLHALISVTLKKEFRPFTAGEIADRLSTGLNEIIAETEKPETEIIHYKSGEQTILISDQFELAVSSKILNILAEHHKNNPLFSNGLEPGEIAGKAGLSNIQNGKLYLSLLLGKLQAMGKVEMVNNTWIISGHKANLDKRSIEESAWLENEILACGENKPVLSEIEAKASDRNIPKHKVKSYLSFLAANGKIRFFGSDIIHCDILNNYKKQLLSRLAENENGIPLLAFKDSLGTKRLRALLIQIFESDKLIKMETGEGVETTLFITDAGREFLEKSQ